MECRYVATLVARSVSLRSEDDPLLVYSDERLPVRATITMSPDEIVADAEMSVAVVVSMITGIFVAMVGKAPRETLDDDVAAIRAERRRASGSAPYLIVESSMEVEPVFDGYTEVGRFGVCVDAFDKPTLLLKFRRIVDRVVSALVVTSSDGARFDLLHDDAYLVNDAGKRIFSYSPQFGGFPWFGSAGSSVLREQVAAYLRSDAMAGLESVESLLRAAVDHQNEPLRRFLAGWSALEIFVNRTFKACERQWFAGMSAARPETEIRQLDRIRDVMRDKYRLSDKFSIVAAVLDPVNAPGDASEFASLKELRDNLLHRGTSDEAHLPIDQALALLRKYLALRASA